MFRKLNGQGAASDEGFIVQFEGRFGLRYEDDRRSVILTVEDGADSDGHFVFIYPPPTENGSPEIVKRVVDALRFLRIRSRVAS